MSNTMHKMTVLNMVERDIENRYSDIKQQTAQLLTNLSTQIPLLNVALPTVEKWISGKEKQYLPKIQDMVNMSVEACFADPDISINDGYDNVKQLVNSSIDELIKSKSNLTLESVDQILQILVNSKLSL